MVGGRGRRGEKGGKVEIYTKKDMLPPPSSLTRPDIRGEMEGGGGREIGEGGGRTGNGLSLRSLSLR
jgi:hypothetical protein